MADDQDTALQDQETQTVEISPEVQAMIEAATAEAMQKTTEKYKNEISGLNKKVSKQDNELAEQKKAAMNEEERHNFDKQELANLRDDFQREQNKAKAVSKATELNVPIGMIDTISMDNWDSAEEQINKLKGILDAERSKIADSYAKDNGDHVKTSTVKSGKSPKEMTASEVSAIFIKDPEEGRRILAARKG